MPQLRLKIRLIVCGMLLISSSQAFASDHRGLVRFNAQPVPGATITAIQGQQTVNAITDQMGSYLLTGLADGVWHIKVEMPGFAPLERDVTISGAAPVEGWDLRMLSLAEMAQGISASPAVASKSPTDTDARQPLLSDGMASADDSLLINGTVNNGASTAFGQSRAFGNNRKGTKALYNGSLGIIANNSIFDARAYSLSGLNSPKPSYNHLTGLASFGGPLRIPYLIWQNGPNFTLNYQWVRDHNASVQAGLVPTVEQRAGDLSSPGTPVVIDPKTHQPFPGNIVPVSSQAQALLTLYPLPNSASNPRYNYQIPTVGINHQDNWQTRLTQKISKKEQVYGTFSGQSIRGDTTNLFDFTDKTNSLGLNSTITLQRVFTPRLSMTLGYQYSRLAQRVTPYFAGRINVSGQAGIGGNDQDVSNWGPPTLNFASGIATLFDTQSSFARNQTNGVAYSALWSHNRHNIRLGVDFQRQQFNLLGQQDPRGTFAFTGAASGYDFADFLLGTPDTSSIAFGNADKYLRASVYDAYIADDFRISPGLTINAGLRWDYGSPITEKYNRLVNLDIAPAYTAIAPVIATAPVGALTGRQYPHSLVQPDRLDFEPRIGSAWRPITDSSLVLRAGYGIYYNTSIYLPIASAMAQQSPLSKSLSLQNSANYPLTLANGFSPPSSTGTNTYAVDPNLRVGYAQNWNLSAQTDLPWSTVVTVSYLGIKGVHGQQQFLPNTYPTGAANPCSSCPSGYVYLASGGNSSRQAGQLQLRRRLHGGFTGAIQYTYAKAIDNASLGGGTAQSGPVIAQNWLDLKAERGPSNFDQRHLVNLSLQYTSGMGKGGITTLQGWRGAALREWTFATQVSRGSGLPQTPIYFAAVQGTGITGSLRPDTTGDSITAAPTGLFLNPGAYKAPARGLFGDAGRNSIAGPSQFSLDGSIGRTLRLRDPLNLDFRIDGTNILNHAAFTGWNTVTTNSQFGLPVAVNPMRSLQTTLRLRF